MPVAAEKRVDKGPTKTFYRSVPEWLLRHPEVTSKGIHLYLTLTSYQSTVEPVPFPSYPQLMRDMGCSRSALAAAIKNLEKIAAITVERRTIGKVRRAANRYHLAWDDPADGSEISPSTSSSDGSFSELELKELQLQEQRLKPPPGGAALPRTSWKPVQNTPKSTNTHVTTFVREYRIRCRADPSAREKAWAASSIQHMVANSLPESIIEARIGTLIGQIHQEVRSPRQRKPKRRSPDEMIKWLESFPDGYFDPKPGSGIFSGLFDLDPDSYQPRIDLSAGDWIDSECDEILEENQRV